MDNLSVAIPTYNSSKYLKSNLKSLSLIKNIDEIIVCDDNSNKEDQLRLEKIIYNHKKRNRNLKLKLYKNKENLGAFFNKIQTIKLCTNQIIYQIDSDNKLKHFKDQLLIDIQNNPQNIYIPSQILLNYSWYKREKVTFSKKSCELTKDYIQKSLATNTNVYGDKDISWILNTGNWVFNKERYLGVVENITVDDISSAGDALLLSYYWLKKNNSIFLSSELSHYHKIRKDSNWVKNASSSQKKIDHYKNKIINL